MSKKSAKIKSTLLRRLRKHFGADPAALPVLEHTVAEYERPNLHLAIEDLMAEADLFGIVVPEDYHTVSISKLSRDATARQFDVGPIEYVDVPLANGEKVACVKRGLYLFRCDGEPAALLI